MAWQSQFIDLQAHYFDLVNQFHILQQQNSDLRAELSVLQTSNGYLRSLNELVYLYTYTQSKVLITMCLFTSWLPLIQSGAQCTMQPVFHGVPGGEHPETGYEAGWSSTGTSEHGTSKVGTLPA